MRFRALFVAGVVSQVVGVGFAVLVLFAAGTGQSAGIAISVALFMVGTIIQLAALDKVYAHRRLPLRRRPKEVPHRASLLRARAEHLLGVPDGFLFAPDSFLFVEDERIWLGGGRSAWLVNAVFATGFFIAFGLQASGVERIGEAAWTTLAVGVLLSGICFYFFRRPATSHVLDLEQACLVIPTRRGQTTRHDFSDLWLEIAQTSARGGGRNGPIVHSVHLTRDESKAHDGAAIRLLVMGQSPEYCDCEGLVASLVSGWTWAGVSKVEPDR
ncbi:MAG: hypothetical protein HOI95_27310 [Chromatiales bacterium]|nr:hypothetical protein [Chromatiales bacterium]